MQQQQLMQYDPATGRYTPYPSHAAQWRDYYGHDTAWLYNPWTGMGRNAGDVGSDIAGLLIIPPDEPVYSDKISVRLFTLAVKHCPKDHHDWDEIINMGNPIEL